MPSTFTKYSHNNFNKRRKIWGRVGKHSVVSESNVKSAVHHTISSDRANKGITASNVAWELLQLKPELKTIQARNYIYCTFKAK